MVSTMQVCMKGWKSSMRVQPRAASEAPGSLATCCMHSPHDAQSRPVATQPNPTQPTPCLPHRMLLSSLSWWNRCSLPRARCDHWTPPPPLPPLHRPPLPSSLLLGAALLRGLLLPPTSSKNSAACTNEEEEGVEAWNVL